MKHKTGDRVLFYCDGVQHRASVLDASCDHVTVRLWDGREFRLEEHDDVARIAKLPSGRRR
jgi:hypothetical protein